ncbi:MAG: hypothetical protein WC481_01885 [Candidatus Omnitrophota bacterium]
MGNDEIKAYFWKSAVEYSKGDITQLLSARLSCAGPLLSTILSGIDNLGGICYKFKDNSKARSIKFMSEKMKIPAEVANFLYSSVRCGIVHQGMPKIGLKFFVEYNRLDKGAIFYKCSEGYIWLNVVELAYSYIETIDSIRTNADTHIHFIPSPNDEVQHIFDQAVSKVDKNIEDLLLKIMEKKESEQIEKLERGKITAISSSSAFTPDNTLISCTYPIEL